VEIYGYGRVSSHDQNEQRQMEAFLAEGIDDRHIFIDKMSGKHFNRPQYNLLVGTETSAGLLREGDLLVLLSLDRFGRNYSEIKKEWDRITNKIKADIKVLDIPLLNTTIGNSRDDAPLLEKSFIRDLVFQILCYVSEKERENIKRRQKEGIATAQANGTKFGRPAVGYPENWKVEYARWIKNEISSKEFQESTGLKSATFYRLLKKYEDENDICRVKYQKRNFTIAELKGENNAKGRNF
jgi:DNA invertase Pin-like site-specific DNA recombinase